MADAVLPAQPPRAAGRPKVWLLADRRGWAYDRLCRGVRRAVADAFECRIAYVQEKPDLSLWDFDLVLVCFWGETWHRRFVDDPRRVVKLVSSHRWQEPGYGALPPPEFCARHLGDAATVAATSRRLVALLEHERPVLHAPQGVEVDELRPDGHDRRDGPLRFGWAGNADDPCKGLRDVIEPAARGFDLQVAGGDRDPAAMRDFYRGVDALLIASTFEGEPRTLLEAMAAGCFVVATDVGVVPELVTHGDNGLVVARSAAAFRAALEWCRQNPAHVRAAGRRNAARAVEERAWPAVAPRWRMLLETAWRGLAAPAVPTSGATRPRPAPRPAPAARRRARTADDAVVAACKAAYHQHFDALNDPDRGTRDAAAAYYRAELLPLLPDDRDARVLDVGAGYGLLLEFLAEHGYRDLHGVELDGQLRARASARLEDRGTVVHGEAIAFLEANPATFDVVTAWDLLEHFPLGEAFDLATAARAALRPGGVALFRTPNMANVLGVYSRCMDLTHQVGFTEQSVAQLLRLAGFDEVELVVPDFAAEPALRDGVAQSRAFHEQLFRLQDRSTPRCFDKNLVVAGRVAARAADAPTRDATREAVR